MRFVYYHQIPTCGDQILEPAAVIFSNVFSGPTTPFVYRLDRIQRDDDLIKHRPNGVWVVPTRSHSLQCADVVTQHKLELFVEMRLHFRHPLGSNTFGRNNQNATY